MKSAAEFVSNLTGKFEEALATAALVQAVRNKTFSGSDVDAFATLPEPAWNSVMNRAAEIIEGSTDIKEYETFIDIAFERKQKVMAAAKQEQSAASAPLSSAIEDGLAVAALVNLARGPANQGFTAAQAEFFAGITEDRWSGIKSRASELAAQDKDPNVIENLSKLVNRRAENKGALAFSAPR